MKIMHSFIAFASLLMSACLFGMKTKAQNILNDTIVVSTNATAEIVFPSAPNGILSSGDGSYEVSKGTKKSLLIKANKKDADPQTLTVNEGSHKHHFVLLYNQNASPLRLDWSKQKDLERHVKETKAKATAHRAEADALFDKGQYDAALPLYDRLQYDVEETERQPILTKIAQCEQQSTAGKQKKYEDAMTQASGFEKGKKYREADAAYDAALKAKPEDTEALKKRTDNRAAWFRDCKNKGLDAFADKNYILAKNSFEDARELDGKAFQQCCKEKYETTLQKVPDQIYEQQKLKGNEAFDVHNWAAAKQAYDSALAVNANDKYCSKQLVKIKEAIEKERGDQKKEAEYYALLSSAKGFAAAKDFEAAIAKYDAALKLFPDRRFAKEKKEALIKQKSNASAKR